MIPLMIISNKIILIGCVLTENHSMNKYTPHLTQVHHENFCHLYFGRLSSTVSLKKFLKIACIEYSMTELQPVYF